MLLTFVLTLIYNLMWAECSGFKTWIPNTNFGNKDNWVQKRKPCSSDRVIFESSKNADAVVYLQSGKTTVKEIILPDNGEFILPNGQLVITESNSVALGCPGEDMVFSGGEERLWVDWHNWQNTLPGGANSPVPHAERLPCSTDQVIFPDATSFKVRLPDVPVTVGAVYIQSRSFSNDELQLMFAGDTGYHMFKGSESGGLIVGDTCSDPLGCVCRQVDDEVLDVICSFEMQFCEEPRCENPVTPKLHCCKVCGAVLTIMMDGNNFSPEEVRAKINNYRGILSHLSRTDNNEMQLVIREDGVYTGESSNIALKLMNELQNDKATGIWFVKHEVSGEPITALGSTSSIVLFIMFTIIIMFGIATLVFFGYQRYRTGLFITEMPSFHFRRFENAAAPGEGEVEIAKRAEETGKSFDNPMFDKPSTSASGSSFMPRVTRGPAGGRSVTMENPTFKALQAAHEEPKEEDQEETPALFASSKYQTLHDEE